MKKLLTLLTIFIFHQTYAQEPFVCAYNGYQTVEKVGAACDYVGAEINFGSDASSAEQYVDKILDNIGLFRNFYVEECLDINNAYAVTLPQEGGAVERYILYDEAFFDKVKQSTSGNWGLISILAHEVGHHLNGHTLTGKGSNHQTELQADEFSGFVLARMKCSLEDAQAAISKMLPDKASSTHPAKADRLAAVAKGWNRGNGKTIKVKKITQDIKNKILSGKEDDEGKEDNKDEEYEYEDAVTAEQVFANYIDAIGGQEKVRSIKTMRQEMKTGYDKDAMAKVGDIFYVTSIEALTPQIGLTKKKTYQKRKRRNKLITEEYTLSRYGKNYMKASKRSKWKEYSSTKKGEAKSEEKGISYIDEYSMLINGGGYKYIGTASEDGKKYYVIESPKTTSTTTHTDVGEYECERIAKRYYAVKTGLLYKIETLSKCNDTGKDYNTKNSPSKSITYYSDYREVQGILFPFKNVFEMAFEIEIQEDMLEYYLENAEFKDKIRKSEEGDYYMQIDSKTEINYTNIEINPPLNPEDFKVN